MRGSWWETLSEDEKCWVAMDEHGSGMTVHFKVSRCSVDENYWIELPYTEWRNLVLIATKAGEYSDKRMGVSVAEGQISAEWLSRDCIQLGIGQSFRRYFTSEAWGKFSLLLEQAAGQISEV